MQEWNKLSLCLIQWCVQVSIRYYPPWANENKQRRFLAWREGKSNHSTIFMRKCLNQTRLHSCNKSFESALFYFIPTPPLWMFDSRAFLEIVLISHRYMFAIMSLFYVLWGTERGSWVSFAFGCKDQVIPAARCLAMMHGWYFSWFCSWSYFRSTFSSQGYTQQ